jgi:hypothetical protein
MRNIEKDIITAIGNHKSVQLSFRDRVDSMIEKTDVYLWDTVIATIYKNHILINSGGWQTSTAMSCLNAILGVYTDYGLYQESSKWFIVGPLTPNGYMTDKSNRKDFADRMSIPRKVGQA